MGRSQGTKREVSAEVQGRWYFSVYRAVCASPCVIFVTLSHLRQKMQMPVHHWNSHLYLDVGSLSLLTFLGLVVYVSW